MSGSLDGKCQGSLVLCTGPSLAPSLDLAVLGHVVAQQVDILVVDCAYLVHAEGADLATSPETSIWTTSPA